MNIKFISENMKRPNLKYKSIKNWLKYVIKENGFILGNVCYIFCNDEYLKNINIKFLQHNYYTDVITFDYCEENFASGDIFISTERVKDNSIIFGSNIQEELLRVMVHGLLHLMGFKDSDDREKLEMRNMENHYLYFYKNNWNGNFR